MLTTALHRILCYRPDGEPTSRWEYLVDSAIAYMSLPELADTPVRMLSEVIIMPASFRRARHAMHDVYRIERSTNDRALWSDFHREALAARRCNGDLQEKPSSSSNHYRGSDERTAPGAESESDVDGDGDRIDSVGAGAGAGAGASTDIWGVVRDLSTVYLAAKAGEAAVVQSLLDANHDPNDARPDDNASALDAAASESHMSTEAKV